MKNCESGCGRLGRDQGCDGCRSGDALVEEGNAEEGSCNRVEDRESGLGLSGLLEMLLIAFLVAAYILRLAGDGNQRAPPSIELLRCR